MLTRKLIRILLIAVLGIFFTACSKENIAISLNQEGFNNQAASSGDNQKLDSKELPDNMNKEDSKQSEEYTSSDQDKYLSDAEAQFVAVSETVYAIANVNIRSGPSIDDNNILALLKKGEAIKRIGTGNTWSQVFYHEDTCYIASKYLTTQSPSSTPTPLPTTKVTPTPSPAPTVASAPETSEEGERSPITEPTPAPAQDDTEETEANSRDYSFVNQLSIAAEINELVCVVGTGGSDCVVSFHKKDDNDTWLQLFQTDGDCGTQGITYQKREGDDKTPAGLYSFTLAFGLKSDPGASLKYRKITKEDYWIDDYNNPYYNTWVNSKSTPGDYISEHLIDHDPSYNYALNINYNPDCVPGLGSAVFLHCYNGTGFTTGCIAISENDMKTLVKEVDASTQILIVPEKADLSNY